ncbi:MAG: bifunctional folylpolyglutamate synthase/dihydrofolate synthase [Candidatus Reconcilbacillus cellulovorans]|uniref:Dihydrofolate synthase/folylpolyglutamate synthase n=1 Tax=Candidatus Reconcilbacillus cellulovorans TaxID=1906605 RepID=A0A2A6E1V3_9BACL|nr:MAG: bifunctional folylpolyglutamate synthase/dihydrofolate synthase [Candidatus Reconcilbacillus cellulovorans]
MDGRSYRRVFSTVEEAVEWITSRQSLGMRPGLRRMQWLMERLDHPERRLRYIHVAGTNGKGSTCAFLTHVLRRAGYDVGTFTSPFLERYQNRIQYNLRDIEDDALVELAGRLKPLADELERTELGPPTMFELSTALAILYYATVVYPDYVVWETGLGGRLDSTNIVAPVATVITNIGRDHMDVLGDTIEQIAAEKAGIIKNGVPLVTAVAQPEAFAVIESVARERKAPVYRFGRDFTVDVRSSALNEQAFDFHGPYRTIPDVRISMNGAHQIANAAVALMTIEVLRQYFALVVEDEDLYAAMRETFWKGRLEMIEGPPRVLLDGAHNPEGAQALADALGSVYRYRRLNVMVGMMAAKDHAEFLRRIVPLADAVIATEPSFRNRLEAAALAERIRRAADETGKSLDVVTEPDWRVALEKLVRMTGPDDLAVVTGSLYLVSDARAALLRLPASEKGW